MRRTMLTAVLIGLAAALAPVAVEAQQGSTPLEVGAVAPDFELPAATRHGVLAEPVRLSDYEGETVVLSFFFRARTKG